MPRLCYPAKSSADVRIDTKLASRPWGRWAAYGWFVAAGRALLRLAARLAGVGPKMSGPEPRLSGHARCLCRASGLGRFRELPGCDTPFSAGRYALAVCMFLTLGRRRCRRPPVTSYLTLLPTRPQRQVRRRISSIPAWSTRGGLPPRQPVLSGSVTEALAFRRSIRSMPPTPRLGELLPPSRSRQCRARAEIRRVSARVLFPTLPQRLHLRQPRRITSLWS